MKGHTIRYHIISTILIAVLAFPLGFVFCVSCAGSLPGFMKFGLASSVVWLTLWKGNEFLSEALDRKYDWLIDPKRRLIAGIAGHLLYTVSATSVLNFIGYYLLGWYTGGGIIGSLAFSIPAVLITYLITSIFTARAFFLSWKQMAVQEEKMKQEMLSAKFETLKNQVNPHFLFNSLNVLTALVYKDPDMSAEFIRKLADVYRYVLDVQDKEVVAIHEELSFFKSYAYLMKMRHGEGLKINIEVEENLKGAIPPLSLQMLLENAVKHNAINPQQPLIIDLLISEGSLIVRNNIQSKKVPDGNSKSIGLNNLKERYAYLSNEAPRIDKSDTEFKVALPILNVNL